MGVEAERSAQVNVLEVPHQWVFSKRLGTERSRCFMITRDEGFKSREMPSTPLGNRRHM